ncbi:TetR/AcrR family transcriptional regulator [Cryobacterium psychrophilum]|nr:TetR/AcrR family transcriptional regulator [Cryobacterium psychrophilum]TDW28595.1 TetR family transcriptional regulator [Cryobacterium psychrophilum]
MARETRSKRAILDAALSLAAEQGISGTSMDDVAQRAGVAKGTLYYNFPSKGKIFEGLLLEGMSALTEALAAARSGKSGWGAIEALVETLLERISGNTALARVIAGETFRTDRTWQESSFEFRHAALAEFAAAITEALPPDARPGRAKLIASGVFGATLLVGLEWLVFDPERPREEVVQAILATFSGQLTSRVSSIRAENIG